MKKTKVDRVYILNEDGLSVRIFPITKLNEAQKIAQEMSEYQNSKHEVKIINEYVDGNGFGFNCKPSGLSNI